MRLGLAETGEMRLLTRNKQIVHGFVVGAERWRKGSWELELGCCENEVFTGRSAADWTVEYLKREGQVL